MEACHENDEKKLRDFLHRRHTENSTGQYPTISQPRPVPENDYKKKAEVLRSTSNAQVPLRATYPPLSSPATVRDYTTYEPKSSDRAPPMYAEGYVTVLEEEQHLSEMLRLKLLGAPTHHLPNLTLTDIINQTPKAVQLTHIPSDLQLPYLFTNRALINHHQNLAIKDPTYQPLDITRAIFFYRLDPLHQFARYHDSARWNIAIYLSLLSMPSIAPYPHTSHWYLAPAASRFALAYLNAVVEAHNEPGVFVRREAFVRIWKESGFDMFRVVRPAQRKLLANQARRLRAEWECELDEVRGRMGEAEYERRVRPFVGSLFPGRVDQGRREMALVWGAGQSASEMSGGRGGNGERNELLEALRVPLDGNGGRGVVGLQQTGNREYDTVVSIYAGLDAVKRSSAREILTTLLGLL